VSSNKSNHESIVIIDRNHESKAQIEEGVANMVEFKAQESGQEATKKASRI